jgi:hypothetical protein
MSQVEGLRELVCVFVRLALKVVMQNDGDIVDVILLYLCPMPATGIKTADSESSSVPGDGRALAVFSKLLVTSSKRACEDNRKSAG